MSDDYQRQNKNPAALPKERGCIACDEIKGAFPEMFFSAEELDMIFLKLRTLGIEIIDQAPDQEIRALG